MKFLDVAKVYIALAARAAMAASRSGARSSSSMAGPMAAMAARGGDVWAEAVENLNTLIDYRFQQHVKAKNGEGGMGKVMTGANGDDAMHERAGRHPDL